MDGFGGPAGNCVSYGISGDGSTVVGETARFNGPEAFRWTQAGGYTWLGALLGGVFHSRALATSHDGSVIVGFSSTTSGTFDGDTAMRWTESSGMESLGMLPGGKHLSSAYGVSADGVTIVGGASAANIAAHPFKWTASGGMVDIGISGGGLGDSYGVSQDGSIIVGSQDFGINPEEAFLEDDGHGFRWLRQVLIESGLGSSFAGWRLSRATGVAVDPSGLTIISGYGVNPDGQTQGFVAAVPEPTSIFGVALGILILLKNRRPRV